MDESWDQEDEHRQADFEHMLARMQQDHEDRTLDAAEASLAGIVASNVPMPDTAHPALERYAEMVRRSSTTSGPIRLPVVRSIAASFANPEDAYPTSVPLPALILDRRKCAGPAPFVGDPRWQHAAYFWPVWIDEYGRHIAGDASLVWRW